MVQTMNKILKKTRSSHVLALLFLVYITHVGLAAFPQFLSTTKSLLTREISVREFIDTVDGQYYGMITTAKTNPLLQNKGTYVNLNGYMCKLLDQPYVNQRLRLENGHMADLEESHFPLESMETVVENINTLYHAQKEDNKNFLFVLAPTQTSKYEDLLPTGYTNAKNEDADIFLEILTRKGIPCLDLRESAQEEGMSITDMFFVTDHHWTPQTGFWAYTKILEKLETLEAIGPVDPFYTAAENYEFRVYEDASLGSYGHRIGVYYAGVDDFCMIVPKFDTDIFVSLDDGAVTMQGRYETTVNYYPDDSYFQARDYFNESMHSLYGHGDRGFIQRRNENAPEDTRLLLIGDSFGNIPFSLMSMYMSSCDELDMRYYTGDFAPYYEEYAPDTVIMVINPNDLIMPNASYPFFGEAAE